MERKLKVLVITNLFPNGKEPNRGIFIKQELLELAKLVELQVVAPVPWVPFNSPLLKRWFFNAEISVEEEIDGIKTYHPRWFVFPKLFRSLYGYFFYFSIKGALEKIRRNFAFEVIYTPWVYPDGFASALLAKALNLPLVLHALGCDVNLYAKYFLRRQMIRWSLNVAEMNISVSQALANRISELGIKAEKITVIPNGVKNELFHPMDIGECRKKLSLSLEEKIILFVGSLEEVKGVKYLIDAFQRLTERKKEKIRLIMIGNGSQKTYLNKEIQRRGLTELVTLAGEIPHEEIPLWMNTCDVFCLPSIREGMPNVVLEAMACGRTIVASEVGGIPEILGVLECGILFKPGNVASLMQGLEVGTSMGTVKKVNNQVISWKKNAELVKDQLEKAVAIRRDF